MSPSDSVTPPQVQTPGQVEALAAVRRALAELERAVELIRSGYGDTLGVRRLRSDVRRLGEDLDELGPPGGGMAQPLPGQPLEVVPDGDYDPSLWADAEDEGLGGARP
ncbi:MAG: hypothetical protein ACRDYU_08385 [Actinomycetes bacterium]